MKNENKTNNNGVLLYTYLCILTAVESSTSDSTHKKTWQNKWKQDSSIHCFVFWCYGLITNFNFIHLITKICLNNFRAVSKEEYPYKIYPPYCQGALYLFDIHTSEQLCHLFEMELHRNYVWIEDVFITGYSFTYFFFSIRI